MSPEVPAADPFAWLAADDTYRRRSALREVQAAVKRGWLDGPAHADRRAALATRLAELAESPGVRPREVRRIADIFALMGADR